MQRTEDPLLIEASNFERLWKYLLESSQSIHQKDQSAENPILEASDAIHVEWLQVDGPYVAFRVQVVATDASEILADRVSDRCSRSACKDPEIEAEIVETLREAVLEACSKRHPALPPKPKYFADYRVTPKEHVRGYTGWGLVGLGGVGLGVGLGITIKGLNTRIPGFNVSPDPDGYYPNAKNYQTPGIITVAASSAALLTGTVLILIDWARWKRRPSPRPPCEDLQLTFSSTGIQFQGRF